ncbi:MAG: hypothetical protein HXY42_01355 [Chloroflexi bacterium]|nr:hypothetical protein [Chloroflexota bacterium]
MKAWQEGEFEPVVSQEILDEYRWVGEILAEERPAIDLNPIAISTETDLTSSISESGNRQFRLNGKPAVDVK